MATSATTTIVSLTDGDADCIFVTATEGGTGYWAQCDRHQSTTPDPSLPGWFLLDSVTFYDMEEGEQEQMFGPIIYPVTYEGVKVTKADLEAAMAKIVDGKTNYNNLIVGYIRSALVEDDMGYIDADAADAIVQVAVFGEGVYG